MCTLVVMTGAWPPSVRASPSLVIAANRDELLTRPAEGFRRREVGRAGARATTIPTSILAPADLLSGGTWLGLSAAGVFVGITNRAGSPPDPGRRSRGLLVHDALTYPSARAAAEAMAALGTTDPRAHNPFHLVMADRHEAHLLWCDGERTHAEQLAPGMHVITERSFGAAPTVRPGLVADRLAALRGQPYPGARWFQRLLAVADPLAPLEGVSIHFADGPGGEPYGTRSSTILELYDDPDATVLLDHPGPPRLVDTTDGEGEPDDGWLDLSSDARALLAGA